MCDQDAENENNNFSVKQLKVNLKNTLKQSGVLSTVKAQIRQEFINGLTAKTRINAALSLNMNDRIMYSGVYHLLRNRRLVNSISVFSAESGLDPKLSLISEEDIVRMVKYNGLSSAYKFMQTNVSDNQQETENAALTESNQKSLLDVMMQFCLSAGGGSKEISVQTETSGPSAREILDDRIHELRRTYQVSKEVQNLNPNKTIEERMVAFQRDCEKRLARDLEIQVTHVRENEIARVRLEEQSRAHEEMENMRKRLEFEYAKRLQAHIEVESDSAKRLVDQEHATQRALYENRQFMQREIDELRSRESAATRRAELESQGIRALEHRLKESLHMIETREEDMLRREKAVEEARQGYQETAHREALARVQSELEILSRERSSLMIEKQHFADEVGAQKALVSSALALKAQLKAQSEELICKEEELLAMQRAAQRLQLQREEEDLQIRKMLDQIDPSLGSFTRCEQIVALIQQKADLQVQLAGFRDAHLLQQKIEKMMQEMAAVQNELRESRVQLESHAQQAALQKEHLERAVLAERAKVASQVHKLDELRQLLHDKTLTVDSLRRQLESTGSGGGGNLHNMQHSANAYSQKGNKDLHNQSQQRAHMSVTDQRAVDFLRRNGNYADAERAQGYPNTAESLPAGANASSSLIDNVIQRLLLEQLQGQGQVPRTSGSGNGNVVSAPAPAAPVTSAATVPAATIDDATLQAQKAQHAAELAHLAQTLQQEQLKAAEMKTQIEYQKLEQERLAFSLQREKLEAQQRMRELKDSEDAAARERAREQERAREREANRRRELEMERREKLATTTTPVYVTHPTTEPFPAVSAPTPAPAQAVLNAVGRLDVVTSGDVFTDEEAEIKKQKVAEEKKQADDRGAQELEVLQAQRRSEQAAALQAQAEKDAAATAAAVAAESVIREQRERLAAQERELERQRREADEWEVKQQQRETERSVAAAKAKEEERLNEEKEREMEEQRLAQQALAEEQDRAQQEAQQEAEREQREIEEREEKEQKEAEERQQAEQRRLQEEQEQKERDEKEQELLNNSALLRQQEAARAAEEEAEREKAEEVARAEAEEQARLKQEEDEKEIMAARQRVMERRRAAAARNNQMMTSSLPTSLQTAAANSGETESTSTSQNHSTLSHLGSAMMPGVSTSLDSFAPNRSAPNKNLFPSSFQNLQDSDSSSDRMEVGDMSEEQDSMF